MEYVIEVISYINKKNAPKLYKVTNYPYTKTLLHVSAINRHPQGDVNTKEHIILIYQIYIYNVKTFTISVTKIIM